MRVLPLLVLLVGCGGARGAKGPATFGLSTVSVLPTLSELPQDPAERDALLGASQARPNPESRKGMTKGERKVEYGAAVGAAILGQFFSNSANVSINYCECAVREAAGPWEPTPEMKPGERAPDADTPPAAELVPWVTLPKH